MFSLKLYAVIAGLFLTSFGMYYVIKQQSRQIELQQEILAKERETIRAYQSFVSKYDENQKIFNQSIDKISKQQSKINKEYDVHEERISKAFKKTDWDEAIIPDNVYCVIKRMHQGERDGGGVTECGQSAIDTAKLSH
jgi:uncharacterized membrane protein YgaE (UPF0421/DUF939 family)